MYNEEEYILLSGIQHYMFCKRQWALIHIEQQWRENRLTASGHIMHERAHDAALTELRGDTLTVRGMSISSRHLGISGQCDIVEFQKSNDGIPLTGREGLWKVYPVEYKRGCKKNSICDAAQLCAQAICLEEMLCCDIPEGALYYGETRHRESIVFTDDLRLQVVTATKEMHELFRRGYTPKGTIGKHCNNCSLKEICFPNMQQSKCVSTYIDTALCESS